MEALLKVTGHSLGAETASLCAAEIVWFNNAILTSESGFIECDEDESKLCSDGVFDLSIDYGKDIMTWALNGCKY
uniref:Fungal lipase-like domain-containing protein n=1 Tax=Panagrolaimus davidi TaxID=227884 RepID=A0A914QNS8_9BILA